MLSRQTPAQAHFQIRASSAMGEGRKSKGSLAVRNLILSSIVNTQLAAGQAFKVERSTGTCFRYIPFSVMGWKCKLQTAASTESWSRFPSELWGGRCCLVSSACMPCLRTNSSGWHHHCHWVRWPLLWLSSPICLPLKTGGWPEVLFKCAELSPCSPLYTCYTCLMVKRVHSES